MGPRNRERRCLTAVVRAGLFCALSATALWSAEGGPDNETCLDCHDEYEATLSGGPHRLTAASDGVATEIACVNCHGGGDVHAEDPTPDNITNPANLVGADAIDVCTKCHLPHTQRGSVGLDPHLALDLSCTSCHSVHNGFAQLLIDDKTDFCGNCHVSIVNQFQTHSNHPLTDGNVTCISCHDFTGKGEPDFGYGGNATCYNCHPDQSGPYLYEHEAGASFSPEGGGCVACHSPHGSPNDKLLKQPAAILCQQCHTLPAQHRVAHNGLGAAFTCVQCHSEVHGSYENRGLLDPQLGSKIAAEPDFCFCHNVDN